MYGVVLLLCALGASAAAAADVPLAARRLVVIDGTRPRLNLVVKGPIPTPISRSVDDPLLNGAVLEVYGALGESAALALPAAGWSLAGDTLLFRNPIAPSGI